MSIRRQKSTHKPVQCYIGLTKDDRATRQNVLAASNKISILDDEGEILQEIIPPAKIFPANLSNQQINQRALLNFADQILQGFNLTTLFIGTSHSGKQKMFDGAKMQPPVIQYFYQKLVAMMRKQYKQLEVRMKVLTIINEKVYDCLADNKYAVFRLKETAWEGIEALDCRTVIIDTDNDFREEIRKALNQKNKLVLEYREVYTSYICLEFVHEHPQKERHSIISRIQVIEIPGVEALGDSHNYVNIKQNSIATKGLLGFSTLINDLAKYPDSTPHYQSSNLSYLLKEDLAGNCLMAVFFMLRIEDADGSLATLKYLTPFVELKQYPIINESNSFGLLKKYRTQIIALRSLSSGEDFNSGKKEIENQLLKIKAEEDYNRLKKKYEELKEKYSKALKAKSDADLELIKCEEEKLEIGKTLVQVQIENTKLLEKLQNKDYENGKKILEAENLMAEKDMTYQQCLDKIKELTYNLNETMESKKDLEVEFITLKRNYLLQQKELTKLKKEYQDLSLDFINISKENERIKQDLIGGKKNELGRSRVMLDMQTQKYEQARRQNKQLEEKVSYLESEVERYRNETVQLQLKATNSGNGSRVNGFGKDYERIELENENMQLSNRLKLNLRKIDELEDKVGFYTEENQALEAENRQVRSKEQDNIVEYRKKLEHFTHSSNLDNVVRQMKENFQRKDAENLQRIASLNRDVKEKKRQIQHLKTYIRQLLSVLEEWAPKGANVPQINKWRNLELGQNEQGHSLVDDLKIKNVRLEQELRRFKDTNTGPVSGSGQGQIPTSQNLKESRVGQQYSYLRGSNANMDVFKLRQEKNELAEENRRLSVLLKDSNKMDLNILRKEMDQLRKENDSLKNQSSVSPSTGDQRVKYFEKYLKQLEKERSELLSRCVVAQEQVRNLLAKIGKPGTN